MSQWRLVVRDAQLGEVCELKNYERVTAVLKWNDAGTWLVDGLATAALEGLTLTFNDNGADKVGLVVYRDNQVLFSGPMTAPETTEDTAGALKSVQGTDDTALLGDRLIYPCEPDPTIATGFPDAAHDTASGPAESVLRHYVTSQASATAFGIAIAPTRQIPGLVLGAYGGYGSPVTKAGRFQNLLGWLQEIATPDALRFQIRQGVLPGQREFVVTQPQDRRATVLFSQAFRNVTKIVARESAATANAIVGAGGGETTARTTAFRDDWASQNRYGRKEAFVDQRQTTDLVEIGNAVAAALEAGRGNTSLELTPIDSETVSFGTHYDLGDRVTVELTDGTRLDAYVAQVTLDFSAAGVVITPVVQTTTAVRMGASGRVERLRSSLGALQANAEGETIGMVKMWHRPVAEIPAGWRLLDGSDPTLPDLRDRFVVGSGGAYAVNATFGIAMSGGAVLVNLAHHHGMPHDHAHKHEMPHDHGHSHGMAHSHSHSHTGDAHHHTHTHAGAAHTHSHSHSGDAHHHAHTHSSPVHSHSHGHTIPDLNLSHTHTTPTHTHSHTHGMQNHTHTYGWQHAHATKTGTSNQSLVISSGAGATAVPVAHDHNIATDGGTADVSGAPSNNTTVSDATAGGAVGTNAGGPVSVSTASDSTNSAAANTGSDSSAATFDSVTGTDASPASAGNTGSDSSAATFDAQTGTDATGSSQANTVIDATAASSSTTGFDHVDGAPATSPVGASQANTADAGSATFAVTPPGYALAFIARIL